MPLLNIKLMEEFKIKGKESTMTFKTRSDHYTIIQSIVLYYHGYIHNICHHVTEC